MLSTESAILRLRRDLTLGTLLKAALAVAVLVAMVAPVDKMVALVVIGGVWLALSYTSARGSRLAADSPGLIAAGEFEEAERQIDLALRSFSVFRAVKLQSLHHLAVLRHAQRRWPESAMLCRALLGTPRLGAVEGLAKPSRLLLAEAMLEMNDLRGAHEAIAGLYAHRLSLDEVLTLLLVQLDYEARIGAWDRMIAGVMHKVQLAELMPTSAAARAQAMLALAANRTGRADWADWLRGRAELLADPGRLVAERPVLKDLWAGE